MKKEKPKQKYKCCIGNKMTKMTKTERNKN